jgi:hypothetical protein
LRDLIAVRAPALPAQSIPGGRVRKGGEAPRRGGHETYQILGSEVFPFDDREVARAVLAELHRQRPEGEA